MIFFSHPLGEETRLDSHLEMNKKGDRERYVATNLFISECPAITASSARDLTAAIREHWGLGVSRSTILRHVKTGARVGHCLQIVLE